MKCLNCGNKFNIGRFPPRWKGFDLGPFVCSVRCLSYIRTADRCRANAVALKEAEERLGDRLKTAAGHRWLQTLRKNEAYFNKLRKAS